MAMTVNIWRNATKAYGKSLPTMNSAEVTGDAKICWIVPVSLFSHDRKRQWRRREAIRELSARGGPVLVVNTESYTLDVEVHSTAEQEQDDQRHDSAKTQGDRIAVTRPGTSDAIRISVPSAVAA